MKGLKALAIRRFPVPAWVLVVTALLLVGALGAAADSGDEKALKAETERADRLQGELEAARTARTVDIANDPRRTITQATTTAPPQTTSTTRATTTTTTTTTTAPGPKTSFAGEGVFRVGTDIQPGTYRSAGPSRSGRSCYWARLRNLTGNDDVIANSLESGPNVVTVLASDVAVRTSGCERWEMA